MTKFSALWCNGSTTDFDSVSISSNLVGAICYFIAIMYHVRDKSIVYFNMVVRHTCMKHLKIGDEFMLGHISEDRWEPSITSLYKLSSVKAPG